jgi:murein DD-endopeptidase MepM/ murein hydrolase activator NlpD
MLWTRAVSTDGSFVPGCCYVGKIVKQGHVIATLAGSSTSQKGIFPHLHISVGWTCNEISYDRLDWENIGDPNTLTLLDPLQVIG